MLSNHWCILQFWLNHSRAHLKVDSKICDDNGACHYNELGCFFSKFIVHGLGVFCNILFNIQSNLSKFKLHYITC